MSESVEAKPFPCLVCKKPLEPVMPWHADGVYIQPSGALTLSGEGMYGSRVFDPMNGSYIQGNICDECLEDALKEMRVGIFKNETVVTVNRVALPDRYKE